MGHLSASVVHLTWADFDVGVQALAQQIRVRTPKPLLLVAQPRGGFALGLALSHALGQGPRSLISADDYETGECDLAELTILADEETIVWVDDIIDSGATIAKARARDASIHRPAGRYALYAAWVTKRTLDHDVVAHLRVSPKTWVRFPWEQPDPAAVVRSQQEWAEARASVLVETFHVKHD
jgi:hypoxanthine phosphoribosyltransferase